jgi:hypothetical protein
MKLFEFELGEIWKKASYNIFGYHRPFSGKLAIHQNPNQEIFECRSVGLPLYSVRLLVFRDSVYYNCIWEEERDVPQTQLSVLSL